MKHLCGLILAYICATSCGHQSSTEPVIVDELTPAQRCEDLIERGQHQQAEAIAETELAHGRQSGDLHACLGLALNGRGLRTEAIAALRLASSLPLTFFDSARVANDLGALLVANHDYAAALSFFERAITLDAAYITPRINLGLAHLESGNKAAALEVLLECLRLHPQEAECRRGAALAATGK